mgnify:FL=1|tara:strand:- start:319 stop:645 length:327 start_codon:yes stop_codon:yes gene_type:complete
MDIKKSQKKVDDWIKKYGVRYFDIMTNMAILTEEVGEVARVIVREYGEQSKRKDDKNLDLSEELSDVLFVVFCIANQTNIDLQSEFERKLIKKSIRDLSRHKENKKLF